jgi:predicted metal-dependent hydrolase
MTTMKIGELELQLNRKSIKNLHINVLPPDGKVRVSAPERMTKNAIRAAIVSKLPWIKKQQKDFAEQPRQSERQMVSGESHFLWGKRYRLVVKEQVGKSEIEPKGNHRMYLSVPPGTIKEKRTQVITEFYRAEIKDQVRSLMPAWEKKIGVKSRDWGIKKMKTKWGSCNIAEKRIWLNLELAKKPIECMEYILVHELVHLLERHHNERFKNYMDKFMPNWRERRDLLNSLPLAHEEWDY